MSQRIVVDGRLLTLRAAALQWGEEPGRGDARGTSPVHLRWMIHRMLGLPLQPFQIWRMSYPGGARSKQDLADNGDWKLVEIVGLPINSDEWAVTGYSRDPQGLVDAGLLDPVEAARQRLIRGAPPKGWPPFGPDGDSVPAWEKPDENGYLDALLRGELLPGLRDVLLGEPVPERQQTIHVDIERPVDELRPRLLLNNVVGSFSGGDKPRGSWRPLSVMAMAAGSDPLAALALGFGTAIDTEMFGEEIYMVTVRCADGQGNEAELADIALGGALIQRVPKPAGLATHLARTTRPQRLDGIRQESIGVTWDRPPTQLPPPALAPEVPTAVAYAVARVDRGRLLLTRRPPDVQGWLSFVPGKPINADPILFLDHNLRGDIDSHGVEHANPLAYKADYAVAAQDIFGRWSDWETVSYSTANEPPQRPTVISVTLDNAGRLMVDFSWDWSDRSPQFIELQGVWTDAPGAPVASVKITFAGGPVGQAVGGGAVAPLSVERTPCGWGVEQDSDDAPLPFSWTGVVGSEPGTRYYRWTTHVDLAFTDARWREFGVAGRGQQRLHFAYFGSGSTWNISPWSAPATTRVWDDRRPSLPAVSCEAPLWASLPDALGIARFVLEWPAAQGAAGYIVYEATETALLSAKRQDQGPAEGPEKAEPDTTISYADRLRDLKTGFSIGAHQKMFRRVTSPPLAGLRLEVSLPRGSKVIHFFAVTSVTENQKESDFPAANNQFFAVAAPRLSDPPTLGLSVAPAAGDAGHVDVRLELAGGERAFVELYRTTVADAAADVGSMGPPVAKIDVAGAYTYADATVTPGWLPQRYRAVAWSVRDDLLGLVERRSAPTPQAVVLVPPPPALENLAGNQPLSTPVDCLVVWTAPSLAAPAPSGATAVVEVRGPDASQSLQQRFSALLSEATRLGSVNDLPAPAVGAGKLFAFDNGVYRAWVKRPAADAKIAVTVKMIDPLGGMARGTVVVDPIPPEQQTVIVPAWQTLEQVLNGDDMGMDILSATELGLRVAFIYLQQVPGFADNQVITIAPRPGARVVVGSLVTVSVNQQG
ncbi:hypothetical protein [Rhodoblastus sp.]|jgi:hypothetical protein|uniref:hypothetical protein n=1 Tax=Rhodoblastus sp. TaxID=1962975 RepID=UPI0025E25EF8|nr:hypothetical protein [Rhodoblastus sp.]